jgi:hypothetical protein
MTSAEFETALRGCNRRKPFRTYLVELVSGDRRVISHPECLARFGTLFLYRGPESRQRIFTAGAVCQIIFDPITRT